MFQVVIERPGIRQLAGRFAAELVAREFARNQALLLSGPQDRALVVGPKGEILAEFAARTTVEVIQPVYLGRYGSYGGWRGGRPGSHHGGHHGGRHP
jgi:hypothetical protein